MRLKTTVPNSALACFVKYPLSAFVPAIVPVLARIEPRRSQSRLPSVPTRDACFVSDWLPPSSGWSSLSSDGSSVCSDRVSVNFESFSSFSSLPEISGRLSRNVVKGFPSRSKRWSGKPCLFPFPTPAAASSASKEAPSSALNTSATNALGGARLCLDKPLASAKRIRLGAGEVFREGSESTPRVVPPVETHFSLQKTALQLVSHLPESLPPVIVLSSCSEVKLSLSRNATSTNLDTGCES
mmetsp:Transcript_13159/g.43604  ORF Transcript_13159/g.43604 Transcript_13159/m.43604 type:complete len:241 (-) Transcript_13159:818-1540(-)